MERYSRIQSVTFGETELPLPLSVRLFRRAQAKAAAGDNDTFATSVEIADPSILAEVAIRGTAAAEGLILGQSDTLTFTIAASSSQGSSRVITLTGAVLVAVDLLYEQTAMASATVRFVAEAIDGQQEPFSAEDQQ